MQTKLTLSLERETIKHAKEYARKHKKSVSEIVETYFKNLTDKEYIDTNVINSPITDSLAGSLKDIKLTDLKKERSEYLERKHIKK